uniref:(California timema) hypothetical protein n=1 Tax=Timema californicum TaxID=61474 RepID=A0A7R9J916_TIMCA|nr:unnamed protein product [Timema californicum]
MERVRTSSSTTPTISSPMALDTEGENNKAPEVVGEPEKWEERKPSVNQPSRVLSNKSSSR